MNCPGCNKPLERLWIAHNERSYDFWRVTFTEEPDGTYAMLTFDWPEGHGGCDEEQPAIECPDCHEDLTVLLEAAFSERECAPVRVG